MNIPRAIRFAIIAAITIALLTCYVTWSFSFFEFSKWDRGDRFFFAFFIAASVVYGEFREDL